MNYFDEIKFSSWNQPSHFDGFVCIGHICFKAICKNGRELFLTLADSATISKFDIERNKNNLDDLKNNSIEMVKYGIQDLIEQYLTGRMGIKGYKGRFCIQKLNLIN